MAYIYRHTRLDKNEPFYIGIGSDNKFERAFSKKYRNNYWNSIVKKTDYKVDILIFGLSREDACFLEIELIKKIGRKDLQNGTLVNMTNGGDGISGYIYTDEQRKKHLERMSGKNNHFYGKKFSEEHKLKLSLAHKNISNETRKKMSIAKKNISDKTRLKMSISKSKKVIDTKTGFIFNRLKDASIYYKINYSNLCGMLNGKRNNYTNLKYI